MAPSDEGAVSEADWGREMKQYNKSNIPLAKDLRKNMTPWERKLWYDFLSRYPVRFQRQKAIGNYIADFYCAKAHLIVELDGSGHYEPAKMDADLRRTRDLEAMNLQVLRICNLDIDRNFRGVCEYIDQIVQKSLPQSASLTAPSSEGAITQRKIFALGFFDGVHLGHQALLEQCKRLACQLDAQAAAITFEAHPQSLFGNAPVLINSTPDREGLLRAFGIAHIRILPVTEQTMGQHWQDFLLELLAEGAAGFVCGYDFRFGHKGQGDAEKLQRFCREHDLLCLILPEQTMDGIRISSTHIRTLIEQGEMEAAARFMGHPHILSGQVVPGRQLGRTIGVPTANILIPDGVVVPKLGVYACRACVGGHVYAAVTNIGSRPTVNGHQVRAESWILDFDGDLYGKTVTLEFHKFLRPERKFDSLEELRTQIHHDAAKTIRVLQ